MDLSEVSLSSMPDLVQSQAHHTHSVSETCWTDSDLRCCFVPVQCRTGQPLVGNLFFGSLRFVGVLTGFVGLLE